LLLLTGWGLLAAALVNVFRNLYQVVQYHRLLRPTLKGSLSGIPRHALSRRALHCSLARFRSAV
jgi:hypothetical protein